MIAVTALPLLFFLLILSPYVNSTVITVNWHYGHNDVECCVTGTCPCGSLHYALQNLGNNSIINITSDSETLNTNTSMGSGSLRNITITGNGAYIWCYNRGGVYCESCSDVIIEGIKWYKCSINQLLYSVLSINISYCTFCLTEGYFSTERKLYGNYSLFIHYSRFLPCDPVESRESNLFGGYSLRHFGNRQLVLIKNSIFSIKLKLDLQGSTFYHLMIISSIFDDYGSLDASVSSYTLQSRVVIQIINTTFSGKGVTSILSQRANHTNISISNTQFVSIQQSGNQLHEFQVGIAISINDNVGYLTLNNVTFVGNKGHGVLLWIEAQNIKKGLYITFHKTQFVSNNFTNRIVSIRHVANDVDNAMVHLRFTECTWLNNIAGNSIVYVLSLNSETFDCSFVLSDFVNSTGSALQINVGASGSVTNCFTRCTFVNNTKADHGAALFLKMKVHMLFGVAYKTSPKSKVTLSQCRFEYNVAEGSIVYVYDQLKERTPILILNSSSFTNNIGSALYISSSTTLTLHSENLFENNKADNGAAIYFNENSVLSLDSSNAPSVRFIGNIAAFRGGAIYVDFIPFNQNCFLVSTYISQYATNSTEISFNNNTAIVAGNDVYFNFHESCQIYANSKKTDWYALGSSFIYTQPDGAVTTTPYMVNLCSANSCDLTNDSYYVDGPKMLGHPIYFTAQLYDYFNNTSKERVQFRITCTNCNSTYRLSHDELLLNDGRELITVIAVNSTHDVNDEIDLNLILTSLLPFELRPLTTRLSFNLSPCFSGFAFSINSQTCECYNDDYDDYIIQCNEDNAEIKQGHWFGSVLGKRTVSLCPNFYCDFSHRADTGNGYYNLPRELDGQCRPHRSGVACGDCSSGYTLPYNAPDCIDERKCSGEKKGLVIGVTILYWFVIVGIVCILTHSKLKISMGHFYGIIYYYSVLDVVLGSNLYIADVVFQLVAVTSSFTKLTPQFIGKICLTKGLSGIDQQIINYSHVIAVIIILAVIAVVAHCSVKVSNVCKNFIIQTYCVLFLMSYTSLASTSLHLLRPLTFNDADGIYCYSSPSVKYFHGRHLIYAIIAIVSAAVFVLGLPCLILIQPHLKVNIEFLKKPFLDKFQECYKDKYSWFAVYYFVCRIVLFIISNAVTNNQSRMYWLHTACVIITLNHIWIQPYKEELKVLNILDATYLLNMALVANLSTSGFSEAATTGILVALIVTPFCCLCAILLMQLRKWQRRGYQNIEQQTDASETTAGETSRLQDSLVMADDKV